MTLPSLILSDSFLISRLWFTVSKNSYVPVCQLSKGIYLFKQKFHFLIRLLKAIRRITDQDSFKREFPAVSYSRRQEAR